MVRPSLPRAGKRPPEALFRLKRDALVGAGVAGFSSTLFSLSLAASSSAAGALLVVVRLRPRKLRVGRPPRSERAVVLETVSSAASSDLAAGVSAVVLPRRLKRLRAKKYQVMWGYKKKNSQYTYACYVRNRS